MNNEKQLEVQNSQGVDLQTLEQVLLGGDLSRLTPKSRLEYYNAVCTSVGLNPLTRPFDYITLNGKLTLYAKRDCTDQLRKVHEVSVVEMTNEKLGGDIYKVQVKVKNNRDREDIATGCVCLTNLKGEQLANAYMKAETKAKRRATLSICGLGMLDETEIESIPDAKIPKEEVKPSSVPSVEKIAEALIVGSPIKKKVVEPVAETAPCLEFHERDPDDGLALAPNRAPLPHEKKRLTNLEITKQWRSDFEFLVESKGIARHEMIDYVRRVYKVENPYCLSLSDFEELYRVVDENLFPSEAGANGPRNDEEQSDKGDVAASSDFASWRP